MAKKRDWTQKYLDVAGAIILVLNADETVRLINRKGCRVLGWEEAEIVGKNWFDTCIPKRLRGELRRLFRNLIETGEDSRERYFENPVLTRDGRERLIAWRNTILTEDGKNVATLSSGDDVTERRQRENSLRSREAELQAIVDTAVDGIITIDERGTIRSFNPAATRLFGYSPEEVIGRNVAMLMPEPDHSRHRRYLKNYTESGNAKIIGIGREVQGRKKDGSTVPLYLAVSESRLPDRLMFTGILRDLTTFKQMQEQLVQSKNLANIGEMAATVAHEIKNPLAGISGAIQVLRDTLEEKDPRREIMGEILVQVQRLDETVRQLLMLSKPWKPSKEACDLPSLVRQVSKSREEQGEFRHISFSFTGKRRLNAEVDPSMLQQVLLNLIQNSAQAMSEEGEITFRFRDENGIAGIDVEDSGPGIALEVRDRLFRPFVTTKAHGTGLGLAICKKIMEAHGGAIAIESPAGKGTRVSLRFPKAAPRPRSPES